MFTGQQTSVRFFRTGQRISQKAGGFGRWLFIAPGLILILFGVAILLWPELLAYMVAGLFIAIGFSITGWGWRLSQRQRNNAARWETIDEF
ncbi:MAG: hypothetical protein OXI80_10800 [Caldilineaceae bacterium]|nr:hypothetical protein [Caldilineaceae bacterium]MDE0338149.1 hypothetical protein [Caldilineaceae bacterium]